MSSKSVLVPTLKSVIVKALVGGVGFEVGSFVGVGAVGVWVGRDVGSEAVLGSAVASGSGAIVGVSVLGWVVGSAVLATGCPVGSVVVGLRVFPGATVGIGVSIFTEGAPVGLESNSGEAVGGSIIVGLEVGSINNDDDGDDGEDIIPLPMDIFLFPPPIIIILIIPLDEDDDDDELELIPFDELELIPFDELLDELAFKTRTRSAFTP